MVYHIHKHETRPLGAVGVAHNGHNTLEGGSGSSAGVGLGLTTFTS